MSKQINLLLERKGKADRQRGRAGRQLIGIHIITFKSENKLNSMQEIRAVIIGACCPCCVLSLLKLEEFYRLGDGALRAPGCRTALRVAAARFISTGVGFQGDKALRGVSETRHSIPFSLQIAASHLESESLRAGAGDPRSSQSNFPVTDRKSHAST